MYKKLLCLITLVGVLFLSSCIIGGSRTDMLDNMNDEEIADARLEQVLEAIKNVDKDALKSMFSQTALEEAEDFDERMEYLFLFFEGEVVSWERFAFNVSERINHGKMTKRNYIRYNVNTDKEEYIIFFVQWTVDTEHPENVGIYALRVLKTEDYENHFCYYQDMEAGIFEY